MTKREVNNPKILKIKSISVISHTGDLIMLAYVFFDSKNAFYNPVIGRNHPIPIYYRTIEKTKYTPRTDQKDHIENQVFRNDYYSG